MTSNMDKRLLAVANTVTGGVDAEIPSLHGSVLSIPNKVVNAVIAEVRYWSICCSVAQGRARLKRLKMLLSCHTELNFTSILGARHCCRVERVNVHVKIVKRATSRHGRFFLFF